MSVVIGVVGALTTRSEKFVGEIKIDVRVEHAQKTA